ncbi:AhpC/TSA family protein [Leptospira yasudae]|uniref:SelL-related redox protein n=1 Tax=Leptospira yasudae TaxID=2202201 RepID=UPI0010831A6D|nr:SelL-related redox protein [Leptospira yasudae]TGK26871.1 AhpC/TSA family protein [Leptospira yasudae]TGM04792.1 AhpC/TSA family protein [Leptospira yasudae]
MEFLPESFKTREAVGIHLRSKTILPCLPHRLSLLVFLRHSGCIFSREAIHDLKEISEICLSFPPVLFFFPGQLKDAEEFFSGVWEEASVVADAKAEFYSDLGLETANLVQLAGPEVLIGTARATLKGHFYGIPGSNPLQMPGAFLVVRDRIVWEHRYRHIGDHPDWKNIPGVTLLPGAEFGPDVMPA